MVKYTSYHNIEYKRVVTGETEGSFYTVIRGDNQYALLDMVVQQYPDVAKQHADKKDWSCSCPDWVHRRKYQGGYCKHIEYVRNLPVDLGGICLWSGTESDVIFKKLKTEFIPYVPHALNEYGHYILAVPDET